MKVTQVDYVFECPSRSRFETRDGIPAFWNCSISLVSRVGWKCNSRKHVYVGPRSHSARPASCIVCPCSFPAPGGAKWASVSPPARRNTYKDLSSDCQQYRHLSIENSRPLYYFRISPPECRRCGVPFYVGRCRMSCRRSPTWIPGVELIMSAEGAGMGGGGYGGGGWNWEISNKKYVSAVAAAGVDSSSADIEVDAGCSRHMQQGLNSSTDMIRRYVSYLPIFYSVVEKGN